MAANKRPPGSNRPKNGALSHRQFPRVAVTPSTHNRRAHFRELSVVLRIAPRLFLADRFDADEELVPFVMSARWAGTTAGEGRIPLTGVRANCSLYRLLSLGSDSELPFTELRLPLPFKTDIARL